LAVTEAGKRVIKDYCIQIVEDFHILVIPLYLDCIRQDYILPFKVNQSSSKQHIYFIMAVITTAIEEDIQLIAITVADRVESEKQIHNQNNKKITE